MKSESQEVEALSTKKPRRRLTPEQRIEERKAEIARIEEKQKEKVRESMEEILASLHATKSKADASGMGVESDQIRQAIQALELKA